MENLRRAGVDDAAALTRLRAHLVAAMGADVSDPRWRQECETALRGRLAEPERFAGWLVEVDGRAVSAGVGWVDEHLPWPGRPDGRRGQVASMATDPGHLRRGYGAQVLGALLGWFGELGVPRVDLQATTEGRGLYERLGFRALGTTSMTWTARP